ncbi:hypothetical protein Bca4012_037184 [Brassica carinata]
MLRNSYVSPPSISASLFPVSLFDSSLINANQSPSPSRIGETDHGGDELEGGFRDFSRGDLESPVKDESLVRDGGENVMIGADKRSRMGDNEDDDDDGYSTHHGYHPFHFQFKGIGNGLPLEAVVTTPEIASVLASKIQFNTFGGNPVCSAWWACCSKRY